MDEGNVGKDLALKEKQEFEERILEAIEDLRTGETTISAEGIEVTNYGEQCTIKLKGITFGLIDKEGNFTYNKQNFIEVKKALEQEGITLEELGLPDIEQWIDEKEKQEEQEEQQREGEQKDEEDLSDDMEEKDEEEPGKEKDKKDNSEQEQMKKDSKNWQEMDLDREFTDSENFGEWIRGTLHVYPDRVYRRQKGAHDFEYVGEFDGKYEPLELSTDLEGKNTTQEVYIVKEDGTLELDEVDSILLTKDGNYGIATKVPDGVSAEMTKSYSVTRTKDGKYLATQLIEKSGQNRDPNLPGKEVGDRYRNSVYDVEEFIEQKEEIENRDMEFAEDGTTIDEIGLFDYFKKKGYTPDAIDRMIKDVEENEISADEAEANEKARRNNDKRKEGGRGPWDGPANKRDRW